MNYFLHNFFIHILKNSMNANIMKTQNFQTMKNTLILLNFKEYSHYEDTIFS